jgi:hypothetical protein
MSQENVELSRSLTQAWNRRDVKAVLAAATCTRRAGSARFSKNGERLLRTVARRALERMPFARMVLRDSAAINMPELEHWGPRRRPEARGGDGADPGV